MNKFNKVSKNYLNKPWIESDFALEILIKKKVSKQMKNDAKFFIKNGYLILKNILPKSEINECLNDFNKIINSNKFKTNPKYFHYNNSPRIVEGWKSSKIIKKIVYKNKITKYLKFFYDNEPVGFSTINFKAGTEQPLHSDYIHFGTLPELYLAGVWFALEKVDKNNGPLVVVPGSHKLPIVEFSNLNLSIPKTPKELKHNYTIYEGYLSELIKKKKLNKKKLYVNPGDAIIWAANLMHGGSKILKNNRSRYSQVVHYHFKNLEKIYNPCYSNRIYGIYADRNLNKIKIPS